MLEDAFFSCDRYTIDIDNTLSITFKYKVNVKGLFTYLETSFYPPSLSLSFFILCFKAICFGFFVSLNRLTGSLLLAVHPLLPHQIQITGNLKQLLQKKRLFVLFVIVLCSNHPGLLFRGCWTSSARDLHDLQTPFRPFLN